MPIRQWTNWDSQPVDEDFWDSVDFAEAKRQAHKASERQERFLRRRRERSLARRNMRKTHHN